ncbi:phage terminase small subunit [Paenibacillus thermotolerans]|uniref:phage terminase small subunit n=1 Tax=Paenibacillus thermotolerans TaxID=3027807 RepID=UPI00236805E8|nr:MULTISPECIES: phage terminase small subunit [unclassified Paenibacillus]
MARERSSNRLTALKLWLKSGRKMKLTEIADELGVSDVLVRKWKFLDKWDDIPLKRPRGAPKGNKNAKGNKGGAPSGNTNALKNGIYSKFLPQDPDFQELMKVAQQMDPLDILWQGVEIAFGKMLWAQRIMFVRDKDDLTKELKREKPSEWGTEEEYELQFAWDKQANDLKAFAAINRELRSAIKQFLSAAPENDERHMKLELMKVQVEKAQTEVEVLKTKAGGSGDADDELIEDWVEAVIGD